MITMDELNFRHLLDSRRYLLFTIGAGVLVAGLVIFGIYPQVMTSLDLWNKRNQESTRIKSLSSKAASLESLSSSQIANQIFTVEKVLPSKKPLLELMTSLNASARESNVAIKSFELSPGSISTESGQANTGAQPTRTLLRQTSATKSKAVETLSVEVAVIGALRDLNEFFEVIENRAPLSTITNISLKQESKADQGLSDQLNFEAELTVNAYFFVQPVTASVEASLPEINAQQENLLAELTSFIIPDDQVQEGIQGGGLPDLFGVEQPELEEAIRNSQ